jgi:hypothetical protein
MLLHEFFALLVGLGFVKLQETVVSCGLGIWARAAPNEQHVK